MMTDHVNKVLKDIKRVYPDYDPKQGYELAGFVWFQGWNDMTDRDTYPNRASPGGYGKYTQVLAPFIRDVRKDLKAPKMPFVIGVIGVQGDLRYMDKRYIPIHTNFRNAMAAIGDVPEFKGNVKIVRTADYWDHELEGLRARNNKVGDKVWKFEKELKKNNDLTQQQKKQAVKEFRVAQQADVFTAKELEIMQKGASNFDFHYMGCGKVLARIGKAFADALAAP
jgi:hypothetical protein